MTGRDTPNTHTASDAGLSEALSILRRSRARFEAPGPDIHGATEAEARFIQGEAEDDRRERAFEELADLKLPHLDALICALTAPSAEPKLRAALAEASRFITQPNRMETPIKGGPTTLTYVTGSYNALTSKMRDALAASHTDAAAGWARGRIAEAFEQGAMAALGCAPWDDAAAFFYIVGLDFADGKPFPPTMPKRRMAGGEGTGAAGLTAEEAYAAWNPLGIGGGRTTFTAGFNAAARAQAATAPAGGGETFILPDVPMKPDQVEYLRDMLERLNDVDYSAVIGGPRAPPPDAPAKPGQGGEGALADIITRFREWCRVTGWVRPGSTAFEIESFIEEAALTAPPADAALYHIETTAGLWRPNAQGYTLDLRKAGVWSRAEAQRIIAELGPEKRATLVAALTTVAPADGAPEVEG